MTEEIGPTYEMRSTGKGCFIAQRRVTRGGDVIHVSWSSARNLMARGLAVPVDGVEVPAMPPPGAD